jgi:radical SAM protein with 4Fe4S-binding SPASM domain
MAVFNVLVHRRIDLPSAIGLEVSTACNRRCHYCPQSVSPHKQSVVSPEVWELFVHRLAEYRWRGAVALTKYNELSLVPKSWNYVAHVANLGCRPVLFSNGDKPDVVERWVEAGAFRVRVTQHPPEKPGWHEAIEAVRRRHPRVVKVAKLQWLHNQAGRVDTGERMDSCRNAHGISVNVDGTVSMCCLDYESEHIVGDIRRQSFKEIWDSQEHKRVRKLVVRGIPATELCKTCLT